MIKKKDKLVIIGSGNVAYALAPALSEIVLVVEIVSRNKRTGKKLAKEVDATYVHSIDKISIDADVYLVAIDDDSLPKVLEQLSHLKGIVAHTSGSTGLDVFPKSAINVGYFYPLQTFVKGEGLNLKTTPFFINGNNAETKKTLTVLAEKISDIVVQIDDHQKAKLHLSAVVVNNFVNHLYALTLAFLAKSNLDFNILTPIIKTTIERALTNNPKDIQSGPAVRGDQSTIEKHIALLENEKELQKVYKLLTKQIQKYHAP